MRKIICGILIAGAAAISLAATDDRERSAANVEERQKLELQRYYYGGAKTRSAPTMPMAIEMYNQAVRFFEKGEYAMAREAVTESLQLDDRNALGWEMMGELENLQQNFEKSKEYYKKSYLLSPSPRVKEKLEKLSKEQLVESKLDTYDEEHFIIKYRRDDPKYEGFKIRDILRDSYRTVSQDLGFYIHNKIVVLLYEGSEFRYVTNQQYYIGGLYDGKIRLPAYRKDMSEKQLRATVAHEMTHAFVAYLSSSKAPAWIQEGLAEYEENKIRPVDLKALKLAARKGQTLPIDRFFLLGISAKTGTGELMLFYQQAFSFVNYLVERFGMYRLKEILEKFRKGEDSFAAIEEVLKISPKRLESEWLETLK